MPEEQREWRTPNGGTARFFFREGDTSDHAVLDSILMHDEYKIRSNLTGIAVDVGAHIGGWTVAAAIDNPSLAIIAIEAIYENVLLLKRNVLLNDLGKRVKVLYRAAYSANRPVTIHYGHDATDFETTNRFIGDMRANGGVTQEVPGMRLNRLLRTLKEDISIMKIDCEGCEAHFLRGPVDRIREITGEFHNGADEIIAALPNHTVVVDGEHAAGTGLFTAIRN